MAWSNIDLNPPARTLRQFACLWMVFFGMLACWQAVKGDFTFAFFLTAVGVVGGLSGLFNPPALRLVYIAAMVMGFPIGWVVSHLILALLFYGVFFPLGLVLRLTGRDALQRRPMVGRTTYWTVKPAPAGVRRYFRPY